MINVWASVTQVVSALPHPPASSLQLSPMRLLGVSVLAADAGFMGNAGCRPISEMSTE